LTNATLSTFNANSSTALSGLVIPLSLNLLLDAPYFQERIAVR
jgi:hypothetical protein